jgi:hypothetical protein
MDDTERAKVSPDAAHIVEWMIGLSRNEVSADAKYIADRIIKRLDFIFLILPAIGAAIMLMFWLASSR